MEELGSSIIDFDINTLRGVIFQVISTLILFFVLSKLLFKPVSNFMEKRRESVTNDINEASQLKAEAVKMKEEYELKLNDVNKKADEILSIAHKKATENELQIIKEAKEEADRIKKRAEADIEMTREQAKENIKREIIEVANLMTKKVINISLDEDRHKECIEQATQELGDVKWLA
ncbi:MAG: F0F1 ATP synthase subunit B [Candidatus Woesearchaeota archaeon]